jgi:hypothetical protein
MERKSGQKKIKSNRRKTMFKDIKPDWEDIERGLRHDEALDKARELAPAHCKQCIEIEAGTDHDNQDKKILIATCCKHPDGIPDSPLECLDLLPRMCIECDSISYCHTFGTPGINSYRIAACEYEAKEVGNA